MIYSRETSYMVKMPEADYVAICDKIRELLNITDNITAPEIPQYIERIAQLNGGDS